MAAMNAQKVNDYFGSGTFADYLILKSRHTILTAHYTKRVRNNFGAYDGGLSFRLDDIGDIEASIEQAFEYVSDGKNVSIGQFEDVFDLYILAIDLAEHESDYLDAVFAAGFLPLLRGLVKQFPRRELKKAAVEQRDALKSLSEALDHAKTKRVEAFMDKLSDVAQLVIPFVGEAKVVEDVAVSIGGLVADELLGPDGPDQNKVERTAGMTLTGALAKVSEVSKGVQKFVKAGEALNNAVDVLDFDELKKSFDNVDKIRKAIELQKKWYGYIVNSIWAAWKQRIFSLENQLRKVQLKLDESKKIVDEMRAEYPAQVAESGYKRNLIWDIER